jgi:hypothetical protein
VLVLAAWLIVGWAVTSLCGVTMRRISASLVLSSVLFSLSSPLLSQSTGRTMQLADAGSGRAGGELWPEPPRVGGWQSLCVLVVHAALRRNAAAVSAGVYGARLPAGGPAEHGDGVFRVLGASGTVTHALAIPNHPSFAGLAWNMQSIDLGMGSSSLWLADNDVSVVVGPGERYLRYVSGYPDRR